MISGYEVMKAKVHVRVELNCSLCTTSLKGKIGVFIFVILLKRRKWFYSSRGGFLSGFKKNFNTEVLKSKLLLIFLKLRVVSQDVKLSLHELDELYVIFKVLLFFFKWKITLLGKILPQPLLNILSLILLVRMLTRK